MSLGSQGGGIYEYTFSTWPLKVCVCSYGEVRILLLTVGDGTVLWQLPYLNFCIVTILDGDNQYVSVDTVDVTLCYMMNYIALFFR
jgi:hypothetical protein